MLFGDDVINFVGKEGNIPRKQAVLTQTVSSLFHQAAKCCWDIGDAHGVLVK
jgi:hypothetical protein